MRREVSESEAWIILGTIVIIALTVIIAFSQYYSNIERQQQLQCIEKLAGRSADEIRKICWLV